MNQRNKNVCKCKQSEDDHTFNLGVIMCHSIKISASMLVLSLSLYGLWQIFCSHYQMSANSMELNKLFHINDDHHERVSRSIKANELEQNSFGLGEKELVRDSLLSSKNENLQLPKKKTANKETFEELVNSLFGKIWSMHNDIDRSHFDSNMKAVFQAWFPVFDALLPRNLTEKNEPVRSTRSVEKINKDFRKDLKKREVDKRDKGILKNHQNLIDIISSNKNKELPEEEKIRKSRSIVRMLPESLELLDGWIHRIPHLTNVFKQVPNEPSVRYFSMIKNRKELETSA